MRECGACGYPLRLRVLEADARMRGLDAEWICVNENCPEGADLDEEDVVVHPQDLNDWTEV